MRKLTTYGKRVHANPTPFAFAGFPCFRLILPLQKATDDQVQSL